MYKNIHFSIGSTESTINIEKFIQEYFLSQSFCFKGGKIFPKPVWNGRMKMPGLLGKMKISLWPVACLLRFILDFLLPQEKGKTAHLFLS